MIGPRIHTLLTPDSSEGRSSGLVRTLGLFTTVTIVVGAVVGSGIFRTPGDMAAQLGSPELLLFVWILAGFITLLGALSNAEVAAMIPEAGGQYVFFQKMYGEFPAFLYGWSVFSVIQTGSIAAIAYVFAEYTLRFLALPETTLDPSTLAFRIPLIGDIRPVFELHTKIIAAGAILLLSGINYLGVRFGGAVQNVFTAAKVIAMLVLVALTAVIPGAGEVANLTKDMAPALAPATGILAIAAALQGAFWTYDGWNNVTYVAGEVRNPGRNVPKALVIGMGTIILVYALLNVAFSYVLPIEAMANSKLVASDMADRLFDNGGTWIALLVMVSTFGTTNGTILASARVYFAMAKRRVFPNYFAIVHERFKTPGNSLMVQAVWSCMFVFTGTFDILISMLLFVSWIFYAAGGIGLFVLRKKMPDATRPYRVPLYPVVPALFVVFAVAYVVLTLYNDISLYVEAAGSDRPVFVESVLGTLLVLLGTPLYVFYRRRSRRAH